MGWGNIFIFGSVVVIMVLYGCDEVVVVGFGYDMSIFNVFLYYYEIVCMVVIKEFWMYNI